MCPQTTDDEIISRAKEACKDMIRIEPGSVGASARIRINLKDYLESFNNKDEAYPVYRDYLRENLSGLVGASLWKEIKDAAFSAAISRGEMSQEDRKRFEASPANAVLENSCIEVIKNTVDECRDAYYEVGSAPEAILDSSIDMSSPGLACVSLKDNGRGFSPDFLARMATKEGQTAYLNEIGSSKQKLSSSPSEPPRPESCGGGGWGIRQAVASIQGLDLKGTKEVLTEELDEHGSRKTKREAILTKVYEEPAIASIALTNDVSTGGAVFTVTTSVTPFVPVKEMRNDREVSSLPEVKFGAIPKKRKDKMPAQATLAGPPAIPIQNTSSTSSIKAAVKELRRDEIGSSPPKPGK